MTLYSRYFALSEHKDHAEPGQMDSLWSRQRYANVNYNTLIINTR